MNEEGKAPEHRTGWFLDRNHVNEIVARNLDDLISRAKWSHMADVKLRENGEDVWFQADWIKYLEVK